MTKLIGLLDSIGFGKHLKTQAKKGMCMKRKNEVSETKQRMWIGVTGLFFVIALVMAVNFLENNQETNDMGGYTAQRILSLS